MLSRSEGMETSSNATSIAVLIISLDTLSRSEGMETPVP